MSCEFCNGEKVISAKENNILQIDSKTISIDTKEKIKIRTTCGPEIVECYKNDYFYINFCPICGEKIKEPKTRSAKSFINENIFVYFKRENDVDSFLKFCDYNNIVWYWSERKATNLEIRVKELLHTRKFLLYTDEDGNLKYCSPKYAKQSFRGYKILDSTEFINED